MALLENNERMWWFGHGFVTGIMTTLTVIGLALYWGLV
jgi:mannose/fructose/N-acetylgalactosamine-specific phosphotransferase system component IIC